MLEIDASDEFSEAEANAEEATGGVQDETMMEGPSPGGWGISTLGLMRVSVPELIIRDAWLNWEEDLRWAHRQRILARAMTMWGNPRRQVEVWQLTAAETERFATWRSRYIHQPDGFEEERMAGDALQRWVSGNELAM